jgi:hypothetical protein
MKMLQKQEQLKKKKENAEKSKEQPQIVRTVAQTETLMERVGSDRNSER